MKRLAILTLALMLILLILDSRLGLSGKVHGQSSNQAAVVVRFDDEHTEARCVEFVEEEITGYELLARSGFTLDSRAEGMGALVCQIEETGCPIESCLCRCKGGPDCVYWSYWHLVDEDWKYGQVGATDYKIGHGQVDGWSWGPGSLTSAIEPPTVKFNEVCSANTVQKNTVPKDDTGDELSLTPYLGLGTILLLLGVATLIIRLRR